MTTNPAQAGRRFATPRARRRARQDGVDLTSLTGSGLAGRILEADVIHAAGRRPKMPATTSPMRRAIAQLTSASFSTIPHFYLHAQIDATPLSGFLKELPLQPRIGLTDLLSRALALALADYPAANCIWENNNLHTLDGIGVGLVVAVPHGILMPILEVPSHVDLALLAARRAELVDQCRAGRLPPQAYVSGPGAKATASSLSNLGNTRADSFLPVIHLRQSSMLTAGRLAERPWVVDGQLAVCLTLKLALAVDHRVLDGLPAAEFLGIICDYLEAPEKLR